MFAALYTPTEAARFARVDAGGVQSAAAATPRIPSWVRCLQTPSLQRPIMQL